MVVTGGRRLGGTTVAIHVDRTSDGLDTSFPLQVLIVFTAKALEELTQLKELEPLLEPKLDWQELRP